MSSSKRHHDSRIGSARKYHSQAKRAMRKSVEQRQIGLDGLHAAQFQLITLFPRIQKMHEFIDEAFAGSPFLPQVSPNSPVNMQRFNSYVANHEAVTNLFKKALDLWMLACGMKSGDNWVPLLMEEMRQTAVAKATGATARSEK
jgi:hypothetical protein